MTLLDDLSFSVVITRLAAYLIIAAIHGFTLALLADRLGDRDPAYTGRLTLNPFAQFSGPGLLAALIFRIGWSRPVAVDATKLRWGRWGLVVIAAGGLLALLLIVWLLNWARMLLVGQFSGTAALTALAVIQEVQQQGLWFILLNVLPLPGLTGAFFLEAAFPGTSDVSRRFGLSFVWVVIVFAFLATGSLQTISSSTYAALSAALIVVI